MTCDVVMVFYLSKFKIQTQPITNDNDNDPVMYYVHIMPPLYTNANYAHIHMQTPVTF